MLKGFARFSCVCCVLAACGSDKANAPASESGGAGGVTGGRGHAGSSSESGGEAGSSVGGVSASEGGRSASAGRAGAQMGAGGKAGASGGRGGGLGGADAGGVGEGGDGGALPSGTGSELCPSHWCWSHPLPQGTGANAIWLTPDGNVWVGGEGGTFTRWNGQDGQYFSADAQSNQVISSIWGSAADDLWATNGDELFRFDGQSWRKFASPPGANGAPFFHQISGSGPNDVWFASDEGLYHWTGAAFAAPELPNLWLNWVSVASASEAWSISKDNQLLKWNGSSWANATFPDTAPAFQDLWAAAPGNMWLIDNGGAWHWDGHEFSAAPELGTGTGYLYTQSLFGAGPDDIWLLSATEVQHRVGAQVKNVPFEGTASVPRVAMGLPSGEIWAAGPLGRVWQLQGDHLAMITPPLATQVSGDFRAVWSDGAGHTFAVGNGWIQNSGSGWAESTITTGVVEADAVWGTAADDVWAVGGYASINHFNGESWSPVDAGIPSAAKSKMHLYAVGGTAAGEMWAIGQGGQYVHYDGQSYEFGASGSVSDMHALWVHTPDDIWAAGQGGTVQRWTRGSGWAKITSTPSAALTGLWGRSERDVWAVASTSSIYHFDGASWTAVPASTSKAQVLNGLTGTSAGELWAIGAQGTILHYTGAAWESEATRIASDLLGVALGSEGEVWAVGKKHFILRRTP